jgi:hypothetical protein
MLKQLNFSQGALGQNLLAEDIGDLFDSDALTSLNVRGGTKWRIVVRYDDQGQTA